MCALAFLVARHVLTVTKRHPSKCSVESSQQHTSKATRLLIFRTKENMQFRWPYPLAPGIGVWGAPNSNHK
jgi:hypothetical protein